MIMINWHVRKEVKARETESQETGEMTRVSSNRHITGHFGDESFQAIVCTGTHNLKRRNKITHATETQKNKRNKMLSYRRETALQDAL